MTTELTVARKLDKVILKMKSVVVTQLEPEEAIKFAHEIMDQADKVLKAINKKGGSD